MGNEVGRYPFTGRAFVVYIYDLTPHYGSLSECNPPITVKIILTLQK